MDAPSFLIGIAAGACAAGAIAWMNARSLARQWKQASDAQITAKENEIHRYFTEISRLQAEENELEGEITRLFGELEATKATLAHERTTGKEKLQLLDEARENLRKEFENLAHRIFEDKSAKLSLQNAERLKEVITPFKDQLGEFKKKVEDVYDKEGRERTTLLAEIKQLKDLNNRISKEATDLTLALKGESKTRGNWGELILERVLEQSGLTNGREYETQVHLKEKYGGQQNRYPDVVVHLPEGRDVVIDAKVTLNAYERFISADDPAAKPAAMKEHINAVRNHIKDLSAKNYEELEGIKPMEWVLMCVPNESAFIAAVSEDASLHDDAMRQQVVLLGPTTLLLTLRIIATMWRTENQNRNALEIAERGKLLYEKFLGFVEDLEAVGSALDRAGQSYREAHGKLTSGAGNLVGQANKLIDLGIKAKKRLPEN